MAFDEITLTIVMFIVWGLVFYRAARSDEIAAVFDFILSSRFLHGRH